MKALLKRVEVLEKGRGAEDYMAKIRGAFERNNVSYQEKEVENGFVIEIKQPTEVCVEALREVPAKFTYLIKFEDEAEKSVFQQHIRRVWSDGTVEVVIKDHYIYLPKDWREKNELEAIVGVEWSKPCAMEYVLETVEERTEALEKTYTIKVTGRMLKKLRDINATEVRAALQKLFVDADHVLVPTSEYEDLKSAEKLKKKYNTIVNFIKSKNLEEEFIKFVAEEGIKEEYSELFEEE